MLLRTRKSSFGKPHDSYRPQHNLSCGGEEGTPVLAGWVFGYPPPPQKRHGTRDWNTPWEGTWDQRLGYPLGRDMGPDIQRLRYTLQKDLGPESGKGTGNLSGVPLSPAPPRPAPLPRGGQTENITFRHLSDAGGNNCIWSSYVYLGTSVAKFQENSYH